MSYTVMTEIQIDILQLVSDKPGYLFKLMQIAESGVLETKSDKVEIYFDRDGAIRRIYGPKNVINLTK